MLVVLKEGRVEREVRETSIGCLLLGVDWELPDWELTLTGN